MEYAVRRNELNFEEDIDLIINRANERILAYSPEHLGWNFL